MAPANLFPPKSQQEGREPWLGVTPVGTPRPQQLRSPALTLGYATARDAQGQGPGTPSCQSCLPLTHCTAVGKSLNLPDSHWEEPMFIIPSRETIVVVSGL